MGLLKNTLHELCNGASTDTLRFDQDGRLDGKDRFSLNEKLTT